MFNVEKNKQEESLFGGGGDFFFLHLKTDKVEWNDNFNSGADKKFSFW